MCSFTFLRLPVKSSRNSWLCTLYSKGFVWILARLVESVLIRLIWPISGESCS